MLHEDLGNGHDSKLPLRLLLVLRMLLVMDSYLRTSELLADAYRVFLGSIPLVPDMESIPRDLQLLICLSLIMPNINLDFVYLSDLCA